MCGLEFLLRIDEQPVVMEDQGATKQDKEEGQDANLWTVVRRRGKSNAMTTKLSKSSFNGVYVDQ